MPRSTINNPSKGQRGVLRANKGRAVTAFAAGQKIARYCVLCARHLSPRYKGGEVCGYCRNGAAMTGVPRGTTYNKAASA